MTNTVSAQEQSDIDLANAVTALQQCVAMHMEMDWPRILKGFAVPPTIEQVRELKALRAAMSAQTDPAAKNAAREAMKAATLALAKSMVQ